MIQSFSAGFITFVVIDYLWISTFVKPLYLKHLKDVLLLENQTLGARLVPAIAFYIIFNLILFYLSVIKTSSFKEMLVTSCMLGVFSYGTYALTNFAIIEKWNLVITLSDIAWGAFISMVTASVAYYVYN